MRKTLIALLLTATLPTLAMAMPERGERGERSNGEHHQAGPRHGQHGFFKDLDLSREQREQIGKLMGGQMHSRHEITKRYLEKLPAAEQKAMQADLEAAKTKNQNDIRALLKPEQQKAFDEQQKKHAERRAEREEFKAWKAQQASKPKAQ